MSRLTCRWVVMLFFALTACGSEEGMREQMVNLEAVSVEDPEKQLVNLSEAIERSRRDGSLYARRAMVFLRKGELDKALEDADKAIELSKQEPANYFVKAQVLYLMGRSEEALPLALQAERNSFENASLYVLLSELYLQRHEYKKAERFIRQALELAPEDVYATYYYGRVQEATGDTTRAMQSYQEALMLKPDFVEPHRELAGLYLALAEYIPARAHTQQALRLEQKDPKLWYYDGMLQLNAQRRDSAEQSFQQALALSDTLQAAHYQLALLMHGKGEYERAMQHLDGAAETYGNSLRFLSVLASSYEKLGENLEALRTYERMVALEPKHTYALQSMARLRYRLERPRPQLDSMAVRQRGY
ncbi:tetratricopeptide repeat protein [uncultured Pontibacter sp.]|uniref:tetratricopeptide repeat protein n=1 Tax=uncultured Pontibacter sp. TaxID=453356 RepID=UPI00260B2DFF|nr:tetratricopeptide repeat protein [uncultured Pontibacter sp.]